MSEPPTDRAHDHEEPSAPPARAGRWLRRGLLPAATVALLVVLAFAAAFREELRVRYWVSVARTDRARRGAALAALAPRDPAVVRAALLAHADDDDPEARFAVALALALLTPEEELSPQALGAGPFQDVLLTARALGPSTSIFGDAPPYLGVSVSEVFGEEWSFRRPLPVLVGSSFDLEELEARVPDGIGLLLLDGSRAMADRLAWSAREAPEPLLRALAIAALGLAVGEAAPRAGATLERIALADEDARLRRMALRSLVRLGDIERTRRACRALVGDRDPRLAVSAASGLAGAGPADAAERERARSVLLAAIHGPIDDADARAALLREAFGGLGRLPPDEASLAVLEELIDDPDGDGSLAAMVAGFDHAGWLPPLERALAVPIPEPLTFDFSPRHDLAWLGMARVAPDRAMDWLLDPRASAERWRALELGWSDAVPGRLDAESAAVAARRLGETLLDPAMAELAPELVGTLVAIGDGAGADALARAASDETLAVAVRRAARRADLFLRGEPSPELLAHATAGRRWLAAHVGPTGEPAGRLVHPADHACVKQTEELARVEHRAPLAVLAMLGDPAAVDADGLAASVRWLAAPERDAIGLGRPWTVHFTPNERLRGMARVGDVSPALEEAFVLMALRRAAARGVEAERARDAIARRLPRLLAADPDFDRGDLVLALAVLAPDHPEAAARARAMRARARLDHERLDTDVAARRWIGDASGFPAVDAAAPPLDEGDVFMGTLALGAPGGCAPAARRRMLWSRLCDLLAEQHPTRAAPKVACAGAIHGTDFGEPLVTTAWYVLAVDALHEAIAPLGSLPRRLEED